MAQTPQDVLARAAKVGKLSRVFWLGIAGTVLAFWEAVIGLIQQGASVLLAPLGEFGDQLARVVTAFVGGGADIISQGAQTTVMSIAPEAQWAVGPMTFAFGIVAAGAGLFAMSWLLARSPTSNLIPFSFTDVPFLGVNEGDEELEE